MQPDQKLLERAEPISEKEPLSKKWFSHEEAMSILGVSNSTMKNYRNKKGLHFCKISGKYWYNEDDLHNFRMMYRR